MFKHLFSKANIHKGTFDKEEAPAERCLPRIFFILMYITVKNEKLASYVTCKVRFVCCSACCVGCSKVWAATRPLPSPAAEAASRAAYSPASSLSFSQYNYLIITLQDWTVCLEKYRGASDVITLIRQVKCAKVMDGIINHKP